MSKLNTVESDVRLEFKNFGECNYQHMHAKMQRFTDQRTAATKDQVWFGEHFPVFTLGRNGSRAHVLMDSDIPFVQSDRGGDVTYHGPGQLIIYCLFDLKRLQLGVKTLVSGLEDVLITYLSSSNIVGHRIEGAPGVYVDNKKIASLGLRVRNGCSFHGIAINIGMDLLPFSYIHPCGLEGMQVTQLLELGIQKTCNEVALEMSDLITKQFYR